jgi:hypothetical protein
MASRSTNTMQEALQKMMREIADMKTLGDADIPWLITVENMVIEKLKAPVEALVQAGQLPGVPPSNPAGSLMGGGMMAGPVSPSADELSRFLGAGAPGSPGAAMQAPMGL